MAVEKAVKREDVFIKNVDWVDLSLRFGAIVATAYLSEWLCFINGK